MSENHDLRKNLRSEQKNILMQSLGLFRKSKYI